SAAVPGYEVRRVALDAIEESRQQVALGRLQVAQTPDGQLLTRTQHAGNGDDAMLDVGQELAAAAVGAAPGEHRLGNRGIVQAFEPIQLAAELDVRDRFDVEHQ